MKVYRRRKKDAASIGIIGGEEYGDFFSSLKSGASDFGLAFKNGQAYVVVGKWPFRKKMAVGYDQACEIADFLAEGEQYDELTRQLEGVKNGKN